MKKDYFLLLVTKKFSGSISSEEELLLQDELRTNEAYRTEYTYLEDFWKEKKMLPAEIRAQLTKVWSAIEKKETGKATGIDLIPRRTSLSLSWLIKVAAIFILFASGVFYLFTVLNKKAGIAHEVLSVINKQTSDTSRTYLQLADGTKVWLNRSSKIAYNENFGQAKREITLSGEAFFDVAKNEKIPLVIHAHNIDIKVKGTAFNVCAYARDHFVETALIRGIVEVTDRNNPGKTITLKPDEKLTIPRIAADSLRSLGVANLETPIADAYLKESLSSEPTTNILPETAWMENKLVFYKTSFEAVVAKMESWYGVTITISNEELRSQRFSGVFDKETLEQALSALKLSYPFQYTIHHKTVIITR